MEVEHVLRDLGFILGAGLLAQFVATFLRGPEMIVLVAVGAVIGSSVLGIVDNPLDGVGAQLIFTVGVAMIFFRGGVGISLRVISQTPHTVLACLLPDRRGRWTRNEIIFLSWCSYTGVIPAAVASILLARGVQGAEIAVSMVALAVCATLLLQATTAGYVARRLGLIEEPGAP